MLRENKRKLFLSSAVILLPVLFGLIVWNRLPGTLITHWGAVERQTAVRQRRWLFSVCRWRICLCTFSACA